LIASGIQFYPDNRLKNAEVWGVNEKYRLIRLLGALGKRALLLSGDVHSAQIFGSRCAMSELGYRLVEVTSSGLTHTCDGNMFGFCKIGFEAITPQFY